MFFSEFVLISYQEIADKWLNIKKKINQGDFFSSFFFKADVTPQCHEPNEPIMGSKYFWSCLFIFKSDKNELAWVSMVSTFYI